MQLVYQLTLFPAWYHDHMTTKDLDQWASQLGKAWCRLDVDSALAIVDTDTIEWSETPFSKPLTSWQDVYNVWRSDLSDQEDVTFNHEVLACSDNRGVVRWQAALTRKSSKQRVEMDGIFDVKLNGRGLCTYFMMWVEDKTD